MNQKKIGNKLYDWGLLSTVLIGIIFLNIIGSFFFWRWDLTHDKRYSLTEQTKTFLENTENFQDKVLFKVYLEGNLPSDLKQIRNAVEDKLRDFSLYAGNRIEYEFIDPNEGSEIDVQDLGEILYSEGNGIRPTDMTIQSVNQVNNLLIWPGAVITYQGETKGYVQFFNRSRIHSAENLDGLVQGAINDLEYNLLNGLRLAVADRKPVIGFLQGHGEWNENQTMVFRSLLRKNYVTKNISINDSIDALNKLDGLIIAGPKNRFSEKDKYVIDQFLMRGGKLMYFVDPLNINQDSLFYNGHTQTTSRALNISDQIFKYGIRVNEDLVVDAQCGPNYIPGHPQKIMPWYFYPIADGTNHPVSKNIDPVVLRYASSLEFVGNDTNRRIPLLQSSGNTTVRRSPARIDYRFVDLEPDFAVDPDNPANKIMMAGIVEGHFVSNYKNRLVEEFAKNPEARFLEESSKASKVLVVGDANLVTNKYDSIYSKSQGRYDYRPVNFDEFKFDPFDPNMNAGKSMPMFVYGTAEFLLNSVDYMMGDESVLGVRSRSITIRPLDEEKINSEARFWQVINILIPLIAITFLGIVFFYIRKRRFAR
ncbi:gliding motility-associated ABC transporter substrate-binding protein GldG [Wandonia haliotis]|uniref:Gliding motility-associated ABC transporter substrate-binding protein GldG n=1 Tax=Wandonia haliotis TaxID=574963 RepID=A0ABN1MTQ8_9FLAO